jgi:peptide chain release factor 1
MPEQAYGRLEHVKGLTQRAKDATLRSLLAQGGDPLEPLYKRKVFIVFDRLGELASEHAELERALADPSVHADADQARTLAKRYAELTPIVSAFREWQQAGEDEATARELATEDPAFAAEAEDLASRRAELEERLRLLLVPKDPNDGRDTLLEVKAGEGGEESALFASDLLRMYLRYAERHGWKTEIIDSTATGLGGIKDATVAVKGGRGGAGAWSRLKFEGGVHRVQRVPVTESQGRIHTSAAGVLVMPEADPVDVQINDNDIKVDVFRSSGPGGQSVNTTDSAVRVTHLPTGIVVSCQNEKSQLQNKEQALRVLRARLLAQAEADADAKAAAERKAQVRTVDRSERVRTYNFPENRISDHRVGYKAYNLDQVIDGDLDAVIDALAAADLEAKLAEG